MDPDHRLVARTLERAWEEKLLAQQNLDEEYHRFRRQQPRVLTAAERDAIRHLAADIPALWDAPTTTAADRKEIIRQIVDRVVVDAQGPSERVRVRIDWVGGGQTEGVVTRSLARLASLSYYPQLCQRLQDLTAAGLSIEAIAQQLQEEGYHPPREGTHFGPRGVRELQHRLGLRRRRPRTLVQEGLGPDEWWAADLLPVLETTKSTLHYWIRHGWIRARREEQPLRRWIIWADAAEVERLRQLRHRSVSAEARRRWTAGPADDGVGALPLSSPQERGHA